MYPPRLPRQEVTEKPTSSRSHRLAQETAGSEANNLKGEVEANGAEVDENGLPQIPEESETKMMVEELKAELSEKGHAYVTKLDDEEQFPACGK